MLLINKALVIVFCLHLYVLAKAQNPVNWTSDQLIQPATLAEAITNNASIPGIINVGPGAVIPGSYDAGMAGKAEGLEKLKQHLTSISKDSNIVIYCGCCPFEHCPNVRPAIDLLKRMHFTNYHLLNIPHNIKQDWIDKGYPVKQD